MDDSESQHQRHELVNRALESIRPAMAADAGGIDLVSVEGGVVTVRLVGTCLHCPSAALTMKVGVEQTLKEQFAWIRSVQRVQ